MLELPYKVFDSSQLNRELQALNLPDFTGTKAQLGVYLRIKCGDLTPAQEQAVKTVVAAHVPLPPEPTAQEILKAKALLAANDLKGAVAILLERL